MRAFRRYRPEPYPGRVTLFRPVDAEAPPGLEADPTLGWGAVAREVEIEAIPCDNITAQAEPNEGTLDARLRTRIDQVTS